VELLPLINWEQAASKESGASGKVHVNMIMSWRHPSGPVASLTHS
jgi:hypothetical protein